MAGISRVLTARVRLDTTSKEGFETFLERPRSLTESYVVAHIHTLTFTKQCASDAHSGQAQARKLARFRRGDGARSRTRHTQLAESSKMI